MPSHPKMVKRFQWRGNRPVGAHFSATYPLAMPQSRDRLWPLTQGVRSGNT